jgi:hypothetical protein
MMAIPEVAKLPAKAADDLKKLVETRLVWGKRFWSPLHSRMDYWASLYFLLDVIQQIKPVGYRRFISNQPRTALDAALSILTRNEPFWRIPLNEIASENTDERLKIGKIERTLQGIIHDVDELFSMRYLMPFWKQVGMQALLRGCVWGKVHVTAEALAYRDSPVIAEIYDGRLVYPHTDSMGLNYVLIEKPTTMGDLANCYPAAWAAEAMRDNNFNPNAPAVKYEYWSNDRNEEKGVTGVLGGPIGGGEVYNPNQMPQLAPLKWLIEPYYHGYSPQALPVVGVPVNGVNIISKPNVSQLVLDRSQQRARMMGLQEYGAFWQMGAASWVSECGRSLLSAVEEQVPQYNELIATIFQHFSIGTYGTWIFKSPTGELPQFTPGIESKIAIRPEEDLRRAEISPINADAYRLVAILSEEREKGILSNILQAVVPNLPSGIFFQQVANAALNALEPYSDGMETFGTRAGTSILAQLQAGAGTFKKFEVTAPMRGSLARRQTFFAIEFDCRTDLDGKRRYRPRPVFKPSLPDDLSLRIQAARFALDPRRPVLSLVTVLENILQIDDPAEELERIWEDIANNDPVIVLEHVAQALEKRGEAEMAARIRTNEFRAAYTQEMQFRQATGQTMAVPTGGTTMPPEAGGAAATQHPGTGQGQAPTGPEMGMMGQMGERVGV